MPETRLLAMNPFHHAKLLLTVAELDQLPAADEREVAFAGRSNAGKSSAINALTNRRRLAYVARQPGKTRTIQMFQLAPQRLLVDLPGYGYARVSATMRRNWGRLVDGYLAHRETLKGLVLIVDIRRLLTPLDEHLLRWFLPRNLPVHILLTKADKLSRSQAINALRELQRSLAKAHLDCSAQLFSSQSGAGVDEAQRVIAQWLDVPLPNLPVRKTDPQNKNPRLKGSKAGGENALIGIKAPAQGGEAGDDEASSAN